MKRVATIPCSGLNQEFFTQGLLALRKPLMLLALHDPVLEHERVSVLHLKHLSGWQGARVVRRARVFSLCWDHGGQHAVLQCARRAPSLFELLALNSKLLE